MTRQAATAKRAAQAKAAKVRAKAVKAAAQKAVKLAQATAKINASHLIYYYRLKVNGSTSSIPYFEVKSFQKSISYNNAIYTPCIMVMAIRRE